MRDKKVAAVFDEMSNDEGRTVLHVLVAPLILNENGQVTIYLAKTVFLSAANHSTVSHAVMDTVREYDID